MIDGGHRLSALRAWVEDDYGDGHISHQLLGMIFLVNNAALQIERESL